MIVKVLTEHHLELLSLKGGCRGSSESTNVNIPDCWKSHALAQIVFQYAHLSGGLCTMCFLACDICWTGGGRQVPVP